MGLRHVSLGKPTQRLSLGLGPSQSLIFKIISVKAVSEEVGGPQEASAYTKSNRELRNAGSGRESASGKKSTATDYLVPSGPPRKLTCK